MGHPSNSELEECNNSSKLYTYTRNLGSAFTDQEYNARYSGASDLDFMRLAQDDCKARTGQDAPADLLDRILSLYHAQEAQHIQPISGVRDVLE